MQILHIDLMKNLNFIELKFLILENSIGTDKYFQNYGKMEVNIEH